ncbi:phosphatidylinositol kinase- protein kinase tor1 [Batrachochytrium dendrobatidis]|nr:phosphatidylinositol kinase- protein kinase tor1 [Batrachochytrium dendrobatidis]
MATRNVAELSKVFLDLKSNSEETRTKAATELYEYAFATSQEVTGEQFSKFTNDVNRKIFELIQSQDIDEKIGGIAALDKLIDLDGGEENLTKVTRFANYLRIVLPGTEQRITDAACNALGHLAQVTGTLATEFVEFEVKRALEWLQGDRHEAKRYAAVLVLKELALNAPTLLYVFIPQIIDLVWIGLRDSKVSIREGAASTLSQCLALVQIRENQIRRQWYRRIFEEMQNGLKMSSSDAIHGSLLALRELLIHAPKFVEGRYTEVCEIVLRYREHRESLVRQSIITIIPDLAHFNTDQFVNNYLGISVGYLSNQTKREKERSIAFLAIGRVGMAVGRGIIEYLDAIMVNIKGALKAQNKSREDAGLFYCISLLAIAVGPALTKHIQGLLDCMFSGELTEPFCQALVDLSTHIPQLLPVIQERLLNVISMTLCHRPYVHPGAPDAYTSAPYGSLVMCDLQQTSLQSQQNQQGHFEQLPNSTAILLSLRTLGTFDFKGHMLHELVRECAWLYLEEDSDDIRKAAALTCCQLLARDNICYQTSTHAMQLVADVLEKLLSIAIADPDPSIRLAVLMALDERFDLHLAQAENIEALLIAFGDEAFPTREAALRIIGRLVIHNPACIMPSLRKILIKLLTELKYVSASRQKEESALLIAKLIQSAPQLVEPYVDSILKVLVTKAKCKETSPSVVAKLLRAIGELAHVAGNELLPYLDDLMSIILDTMQDQSSPNKREAALETLSSVAASTGWVIDPYTKYPTLLTLLIQILKTEPNHNIRRHAVKAVGIIGALDPYRYKNTSVTGNVPVSDVAEASALMSLNPTSDEYYPAVAIDALLKILRDPSLSVHHTAAVTAIMFVFKTLSLKCVPFLPQILPSILGIMRTCPPNILEFYFQQLGVLVTIVRQHIRGYINEFIQLIQDFWTLSANIQSTALSLIEVVSTALEGEFKVYLPILLPMMIQIFDTDVTTKRLPSLRLIKALLFFGPILEDYLHLVIPAIIKVAERADSPTALREQAVLVLGLMSRKVCLTEESSQILHMLSRNLLTDSATLRVAVMETLCALIYQIGDEYILFIPMINKSMSKAGLRHEAYESLIAALLSNTGLPPDLDAAADKLFGQTDGQDTQLLEVSTKKLPVNQAQLQKAWETSQRSTRDDWQEWIRRFSVELLKESPSHALRACADLAGTYYPLARELFNSAFVSCWGELFDQYQEELVRSLETALTSPNIPPETLQTLLHLAEFMEHDDKALPIDIRTLAFHATKCHAYAKALHYKELEYMSDSAETNADALITINHQLQQMDSAFGVIAHTRQFKNADLKVEWLEKLNRWDASLAIYNQRLESDPNDVEALLGRMRCLHNLGEWETLADLAQERWGLAEFDTRKIMAPLSAAAAWGLNHWGLMDEYVALMKQESPDSAFFRAIVAIHRNNFIEAQKLIEVTRELLDTELTALIGESYSRAYNIVVRIQMLTELEEIIQYKQSFEHPEHQMFIRRIWTKRIYGCQNSVEVWQRILRVRALVVPPKDDIGIWVKFANLCRKSGRMNLSQKTLSRLLVVPSSDFMFTSFEENHPAVIYACMKHLWATGKRTQAFNQMKDFANSLVLKLGSDAREEKATYMDFNRPDNPPSPMSSQVARCFLKLGDWQMALNNPLDEPSISEIIRSYLAATQCDGTWYKGWHAWALAHVKVLQYYETTNAEVSHEVFLSHVIPGIYGFFKSISISKGNSLQDTLRLLTMWFKYGYLPEAQHTISNGTLTVTIDTWLQVIPQLIARIHVTNPQVRRLIHSLLADVGKQHPQAIVYSLTVASKSHSINRRKSALVILDKMRAHSANLVDQALLVSQELIRVAILWHEMWHEGLEDSSRLYFGEHNIEGMFTTLEPLHQMLERGPETSREVSFMQAFGRDLAEAYDWCKKYKRTLNADDLSQAWDLYYQVFKKITKQLPQLSTLDLQHVSPKLLAAKNLDLAVPGSYVSGEPIVCINSFAPTLIVMTTKQRPRRLSIRSSDGKECQFLLKGHDDLRQDERVMQLFGLVNTLLLNDSETFKRRLNIRRYPVVPLSPNSGLIGWVPHSDTLHSLIRDYRDSRKILLNIEHRLMLQMAPDYDFLSLLQKVEVFEYALENTTGQDLYKVLWLKSKNSEVWLDRRTNYTRSLALMSMVGYILGLGDRHPSNLMLDRYTGQVIHIDFGDCFEVAINRDRYPERIPFRLTRMLINAMEVSGIDGNYRIACEHVMRVLRDNMDSLMAVLEAFIYDPLINWRLITQASPKGDGGTKLPPSQSTHHSRIEPEHFDGSKPVTLQVRKLNRMDLETGSQDDQDINTEVANAKAMAIIQRVSSKLTGTDFKTLDALNVSDQVDRLIDQATSLENLSECFIGWCPFW